jgi:hypothetical protein
MTTMTPSLPASLRYARADEPDAPYNELRGTAADGTRYSIVLQYGSVTHDGCTNKVSIGGTCGGCATLSLADIETLLQMARAHYAATPDPAPVRDPAPSAPLPPPAPRNVGMLDDIAKPCGACGTYCYGDCGAV